MGNNKQFVKRWQRRTAILENKGRTEDWWNGSRVLDKTPTCCPRCKSKNIELEMWNDEDVFDEELAAECGYQGDGGFDDDASIYRYMVDEMECNRCGYRVAYGPRHYFNPEECVYSHEYKPKTPTELHLEELKRQEEAGQLRMFEAAED